MTIRRAQNVVFLRAARGEDNKPVPYKVFIGNICNGSVLLGAEYGTLLNFPEHHSGVLERFEGFGDVVRQSQAVHPSGFPIGETIRLTEQGEHTLKELESRL